MVSHVEKQDSLIAPGTNIYTYVCVLCYIYIYTHTHWRERMDDLSRDVNAADNWEVGTWESVPVLAEAQVGSRVPKMV